MDIPLLPIPGGHLDLIRGQAVVDGNTSSLSAIEVSVLSVLSEATGETVSEETLLQRAWGYKTTKTRTVSMGISRLRAKVEQDPKSPQVVLTVRGQGYRLVLATPDPAHPPVPTTLPLLGREKEQNQVLSLLMDGKVVELVGPGGVGTSTLARHVAGDDAAWVSLRGVSGVQPLVRRFCEALRLEGADGPALLKEALPDADAVVLDAAESLNDDAVAWLRELLPLATGPLLLTTRRPLELGQRVMVGPLDRAASLTLLQQTRVEAGLPQLTEALAAPVLEEAGGFPLGLVVAAPLAELAADGVLLGLSTDPDGDLVTVLRETLALCDEGPRRLLGLASSFAVAPALPALVALADRPSAEVLRHVHELRARGLVQLGQGRVEVPAAVAAVAATDEGRAAHAAWAATLLTDPLTLRPHRHELEAALTVANGDVLPGILLRHLVVLHVYGPQHRLDEEVVGMLHRVDDPSRRQVVAAAALHAGGEMAAAYDEYARARDSLRSDDWEFQAWVYLQLSILATWLHRYDDADGLVPQMLAIREQVPDRALWASVTINAASLLALDEPEQAAALFHEVDPYANLIPSFALVASFHRLFLVPPIAADVRLVEKQLNALGKDLLGRRWHAHWLRVGAAWLRAGHEERGLEVLRAHAEPTWRTDPNVAENTLSLAAACRLHDPELATTVMSLVRERKGPVAKTVGWFVDGAEGEPPTDVDSLRALWLAVKRGDPVAVTQPWVGLSRALWHMQASQADRG